MKMFLKLFLILGLVSSSLCYATGEVSEASHIRHEDKFDSCAAMTLEQQHEKTKIYQFKKIAALIAGSLAFGLATAYGAQKAMPYYVQFLTQKFGAENLVLTKSLSAISCFLFAGWVVS